jgi:hypothetical protein
MAIEPPKPGDARSINGIPYTFTSQKWGPSTWDGGLLGGNIYQNTNESAQRKGHLFSYRQWGRASNFMTFDKAADALQKSLYVDYCTSKEHIRDFERQLAAADAAYRQAMESGGEDDN